MSQPTGPYRSPERRRRWWGVSPFALVLVLLELGAAMVPASADILEWVLIDRGMRRRTTDALSRYYTMVRPDSLRVRYLASNGMVLPWLLRAERTGNDTTGQLVSVGVGQLTLASPGNLRIALGDDLYRALLLSRTGPAAPVAAAVSTERFGAVDWTDAHTLAISIDGAEYRPNPNLSVFVAAGAAESNQFFWADGTARVGVGTPSSEFAVLLPFAAGATPVGPLRPRLLSPGYGAAAAARYGPLSARTRFTAVSEVALEGIQVTATPYVHTLSCQVAYEGRLRTLSGPFRYSAGIGFEEYAAVAADTTGAVGTISRLRRLSPLLEIAYETPGRNFRFSAGVVDLALRGSVLAQLSAHLSVELRWVSNRVFRTQSSFEHPFALFVTPRIAL